MREILTGGTVRLDGTKDGKGGSVIAKFKGKGDVAELALDVRELVAEIPYKTDLRVDVRITASQMTIDEIQPDGDVEDYGPAEPLALPDYVSEPDEMEVA